MGQGASPRRHPPGQRRHRTRHRATDTGYEPEAGPVLRRRIPIRAGGGKPAEDGLQQCRIDGWRMERMGRCRLASSKGLAPGQAAPLAVKKLAGAGGFEPPPSSLTVRCPTGWTTPQRRLSTPTASGFPESGWLRCKIERRGVLLRYHAPRISQAPLPQEFICPFRALVHLDIRKEIQPKENGRNTTK